MIIQMAENRLLGNQYLINIKRKDVVDFDKILILSLIFLKSLLFNFIGFYFDFIVWKFSVICFKNK